MGKRSKKHRGPKTHVPSAIAPSENQAKSMPIYQKVLTEHDMEWLADEYRRRSILETSLTLEIFAAQYGILADELCIYLPEITHEDGDSIVLWHGTTRSRADSILSEGFDGRRGPIFFARNVRIPRRIANIRTANKNDRPVVIMCSIDLSRYDRYKQQGQNVYVFYHKHIGSEVVQKVIDAKSGKLRVRQESIALTNIGINVNSGRAGIALWINSYLELTGVDELSEDQESVVKIAEWLDAQADAGRLGEVSDEEMLEQVKKHLLRYE